MIKEAAWEHCLCGQLLTSGARACADLAAEAQRCQDPDGVEEALNKRSALQDRRSRFVDEFDEDPLQPRRTLPPIGAHLAGWYAEYRRITAIDTVDDWTQIAHTWSSMGYAHRAAYALWRAAESATRNPSNSDLQQNPGQSPNRKAGGQALRRASQLSDGHVPLRREIEHLARRARLPGLSRAARKRGTGLRSLTGQELRVLRLLGLGTTDAGIADELVLSVRTVNVHVSNILRKIDVPNRGAAARWAHANGLMTDPNSPGQPGNSLT